MILRNLKANAILLSNMKKIYRGLPWSAVFFSAFYFFTMKSSAIGNSAMKNDGDTIEFSGYKWVTKETYGKHTGPGNNYFSGAKENAFVDKESKLHLKLTNVDGKWYCPEVRLVEQLGYGRYYFYMDSLPQVLDKNIVIGMFVYDLQDTTNFHNEIDIEFSKWGHDSSFNSQFVIQPEELNAFRYESNLSLKTRHMIELRKHKITFSSAYPSSDSAKASVEYIRFKKKPGYTYYTKDERVIFNVWLFRASEPSNLKEFEVIISRFEFKPFNFFKDLMGKQ